MLARSLAVICALVVCASAVQCTIGSVNYDALNVGYYAQTWSFVGADSDLMSGMSVPVVGWTVTSNLLAADLVLVVTDNSTYASMSTSLLFDGILFNSTTGKETQDAFQMAHSAGARVISISSNNLGNILWAEEAADLDAVYSVRMYDGTTVSTLADALQAQYNGQSSFYPFDGGNEATVLQVMMVGSPTGSDLTYAYYLVTHDISTGAVKTNVSVSGFNEVYFDKQDYFLAIADTTNGYATMVYEYSTNLDAQGVVQVQTIDTVYYAGASVVNSSSPFVLPLDTPNLVDAYYNTQDSSWFLLTTNYDQNNPINYNSTVINVIQMTEEGYYSSSFGPYDLGAGTQPNSIYCS